MANSTSAKRLAKPRTDFTLFPMPTGAGRKRFPGNSADLASGPTFLKVSGQFRSRPTRKTTCLSDGQLVL